MNRESTRITVALCCALAPFALAAGWSAGYALDAGQASYQRPTVVQAAPVPPVPRHPLVLDEPAAVPAAVVPMVEQDTATPTTPPSVPTTPPAAPTTEVVGVEAVVAQDVEEEVLVDDDQAEELPVDTGTTPTPELTRPPVRCPGPDPTCG